MNILPREPSVSHTLVVPLQTDPTRCSRLQALQVTFAQLCNAIAPVVQETRCWNRVALHHLVYRPMRERFPSMGSQMVCNAIYSVSRSARAVLQHPASPWNVQRHPERPLPLIRFADNAPVYFDRHTLSIRNSQLSMFTLDGRMRFDLLLGASDLARFHRERLLEIILTGDPNGYALTFRFGGAPTVTDRHRAPTQSDPDPELAQYLLVIPAEDVSAGESENAGGAQGAKPSDDRLTLSPDYAL